MFSMRLIPVLVLTILLTSCGGKAAPLSSPTPDAPPSALPTPEVVSTQPPLFNQSVIGYFPDYRELDTAWAQNLTDIIYFSAEPNADGTLDASRLLEETWRSLEQMKTDDGIRLHLSIGGWERDGAFAEMTSNPQARQTFIANLLEYLLTRNLDGADFDWEFPKTDAEFENYIALLTETKTAFSKYDLLVSVALPAESHYPLGDFAVVDRVHLMSYDRGNRHSTYEQAVIDVQTFLDAGIPPEKLILGLPFYGRKISPPHSSLPYSEIVKGYSPAPDVDEVDGMYFNGVDTIRQKVCYGIAEGLGGFMIWEISQDTSDASSLLQQIFSLATGNEQCE